MKKNKNLAGFSMMEVMIVVLIIAILAAIAIPNYQRMQTLARRSEGIIVLENVRLAESLYLLNYETYVAGIAANGKLKEAGNIPEPSDLKYYKLDRSYTSMNQKSGYCVRLIGNIDNDPVHDVLTLRVGVPTICPSLGVLPDGITVFNDDTVL